MSKKIGNPCIKQNKLERHTHYKVVNKLKDAFKNKIYNNSHSCCKHCLNYSLLAQNNRVNISNEYHRCILFSVSKEA